MVEGRFTYFIWQCLLQALGCSILYWLRHGGIALCVGLSLAEVVCGHSGRLADEAVLLVLEEWACDCSEALGEWHDQSRFVERIERCLCMLIWLGWYGLLFR